MTLHTLLSKSADYMKGRRAELRLAARMVVAALAAFAAAHALGLAQGYWAVITALIVVQASLGASLKATIDRFLGTLTGALAGGAVAFLVPHADLWGTGLALAVALAPLTLLAAFDSGFRVAPITAAIVLLSPLGNAAGPLAFTVERVLEIALGSAAGLLVSLAVLPGRAHNLLTEATSTILGLLAQQFPLLVAGLSGETDRAAIRRLQTAARAALARLETVTAEAARERAHHLTGEPDPEPLLRTARRLRHDLVMMARAASSPLPEPLRTRLDPRLSDVSKRGSAALLAASIAIAVREPAPNLADFETALDAYAAETGAIRREGLTRAASDQQLAQLFSFGFALDQLRHDLRDMAARISGFAAKS